MQEKLSDNSSNIAVLQTLDDSYKGWTCTNEDHLLLLEGLRGVSRRGGFFAVGEFQVLDIALQLKAEAIVLGDLDQKAVEKNLAVLQIIETTSDVSEVLPKLFKLIEELDGANSLREFKNKLTIKGADTGSRIWLEWAHSQEALNRLRSFIQKGKVAVLQADITKPETMVVVGEFFKKNEVMLEVAYLSNTISHSDFDDKSCDKHTGVLRALYNAGGSDNTLLIRSGPSTDVAVHQKLFGEPSPYMPTPTTGQTLEYIGKVNRNRKEHYGPKTQRIREIIKRAITGSLFQYDFEFFIQTLNDYQEHIDS